MNWRQNMAEMKCPDCGAQRFYVKDQDDQFNICEFELKEGKIVYTDEESGTEFLEIGEDTETFCNRCAWHDKFKILRRGRQ
jgi:hypothetical protein